MRRTILAAITVLLVTGSAWADPFGAVTITEPVDADGAIHQSETPLRYISRSAPDTYVENEYFMEGAATVCTYNDPPARGENIVEAALRKDVDLAIATIHNDPLVNLPIDKTAKMVKAMIKATRPWTYSMAAPE